jgi:hypothetical protein
VEKKKPEQRTAQQNRALHKYFTMLANDLNEAGYDLKKVLKPAYLATVDIPWTPDTVKAHLWRPIQEAQLQKESTTELSTREVDVVYNTLNRHLGEKLGIHTPFPSEERT